MTEYTLTLTERELWYLMNGYEASFTDPDGRNAEEESAARKVAAAWQRATRREKKIGGR